MCIVLDRSFGCFVKELSRPRLGIRFVGSVRFVVITALKGRTTGKLLRYFIWLAVLSSGERHDPDSAGLLPAGRTCCGDNVGSRVGRRGAAAEEQLPHVARTLHYDPAAEPEDTTDLTDQS